MGREVKADDGAAHTVSDSLDVVLQLTLLNQLDRDAIRQLHRDLLAAGADKADEVAMAEHDGGGAGKGVDLVGLLGLLDFDDLLGGGGAGHGGDWRGSWGRLKLRVEGNYIRGEICDRRLTLK